MTWRAISAGPYATGGYFARVADMTISYTDAAGAPLTGAALGIHCFGQLFKDELPVHTCHVHFECLAPGDVPEEVLPFSPQPELF